MPERISIIHSFFTSVLTGRTVKEFIYTGISIIQQCNEVLGCMGDIERFADYSAARLQDCDGALAFETSMPTVLYILRISKSEFAWIPAFLIADSISWGIKRT